MRFVIAQLLSMVDFLVFYLCINGFAITDPIGQHVDTQASSVPPNQSELNINTIKNGSSQSKWFELCWCRCF